MEISNVKFYESKIDDRINVNVELTDGIDNILIHGIKFGMKADNSGYCIVYPKYKSDRSIVHMTTKESHTKLLAAIIEAWEIKLAGESEVVSIARDN